VKEREIDHEKEKSAEIFKQCWDAIRADKDYLKRKKAHQKMYG